MNFVNKYLLKHTRHILTIVLITYTNIVLKGTKKEIIHWKMTIIGHFPNDNQVDKITLALSDVCNTKLFFHQKYD